VDTFVHLIMLKITSLFFLFTSLLFSINLKIASYNVENLFDMTYSGNEYKEYVPNKHNWTRQNFNKKLLHTAEVICDINADIIALQEIENKNVLNLLQQKLRSIGCYYKYSSITHKKKSAIQVAVLSKYPFQSTKEIVVHRALGYRNILEIKYKFENSENLFLYINHWKSKASSEKYRMLSAKALLKRLKQLDKNASYILLGDFNSDYDEYLHIEKKHNDTNGRVGINHTLKTINSKALFVRPSNIFNQAWQHYNLWLEVPNYRRWSHNFYGNKQALDSIIISSSLLDSKGLEYVPHSFNVLKKSYLFHKKGYIFRWKYKNHRHYGEGYSDHLPIFAHFSTDIKIKNNIFSTSKLLKKVKILLLEKKKALLYDKLNHKKIFIYGIKNSLKLNHFYDIRVYKEKLYQGHYEIIDFEIEKRYDSD